MESECFEICIIYDYEDMKGDIYTVIARTGSQTYAEWICNAMCSYDGRKYGIRKNGRFISGIFTHR